MCDTSTLVPIPAWSHALAYFDPTSPQYDPSYTYSNTEPEFARDKHGVPCFKIDTCIVPALQAVWAAGFKTLGCCCGHGQGNGVISLDLGLFERGPDAPGPDKHHHCSMCGKWHVKPEGEVED